MVPATLKRGTQKNWELIAKGADDRARWINTMRVSERIEAVGVNVETGIPILVFLSLCAIPS